MSDRVRRLMVRLGFGAKPVARSKDVERATERLDILESRVSRLDRMADDYRRGDAAITSNRQ